MSSLCEGRLSVPPPSSCRTTQEALVDCTTSILLTRFTSLLGKAIPVHVCHFHTLGRISFRDDPRPQEAVRRVCLGDTIRQNTSKATQSSTKQGLFMPNNEILRIETISTWVREEQHDICPLVKRFLFLNKRIYIIIVTKRK